MSIVWIVLLVLAIIAVGVALFAGKARNRGPSEPADIARTERATREFREHGADNAPEDRVER